MERIDLPDVPPQARSALLAALPTLGYIGNPLDPWGATDPPAAYRAAFEAFAATDAYDVLAVVHDFPYRSLPSEVETAMDVTRPLVAATRDRPDLLPIFISLTSGEPTPEIVSALRAAGGVPILRGAAEAFSAIAAVARWEARHDHRSERAPSVSPVMAGPGVGSDPPRPRRERAGSSRRHARHLQLVRSAGAVRARQPRAPGRSRRAGDRVGAGQ